MYQPYEFFSERFYEIAYLQAIVFNILKACGCDVEQIVPTPLLNAFMRDHFTLTALDAIAIKSRGTKNIDSIFASITPKLPKAYKALAIESTYAGGNTLQVIKGELNTVYYGDYGKAPIPNIYIDPPLTDHPKKFVDELNLRKERNKSRALAKTEFRTLAVNNSSRKDRNTWDIYYYHLDCFTLFLPNEKLIVLNKNMLKEPAYNDLKRTIGEENIIDLGHDYLGKPVQFNLVVIPLSEDKFILFGPTLPEELIGKLESYGYYVITPASINQSHFRFNAELAQKVCQGLCSARWKADIGSLVSGIPEYRTDYSLGTLKKVVARLTSVPNAEVLLEDIAKARSPFQSIILSESLLLSTLLIQLIPLITDCHDTKPIKMDGSEKERIRYYLQLIIDCHTSINFDFSEFDTTKGIPETIPLLASKKKQDISFVADDGSVHCLLQEGPTLVDGKIKLYSPAQPLFPLRNDYALLRRYQGTTEPHLPSIHTALRRAAAQGHLLDVKLAIAFGADVNSQDDRRGYTALHWACRNGHVPVMQYLSSIGADANIRCKPPAQQNPFELLIDIYCAAKQIERDPIASAPKQETMSTSKISPALVSLGQFAIPANAAGDSEDAPKNRDYRI